MQICGYMSFMVWVCHSPNETWLSHTTLKVTERKTFNHYSLKPGLAPCRLRWTAVIGGKGT